MKRIRAPLRMIRRLLEQHNNRLVFNWIEISTLSFQQNRTMHMPPELEKETKLIPTLQPMIISWTREKTPKKKNYPFSYQNLWSHLLNQQCLYSRYHRFLFYHPALIKRTSHHLPSNATNPMA